jgi:putative redox protein
MTSETLPPRDESLPAEPFVEARIDAVGFRTELAMRGHVLLADEPVDAGGRDAGPTPYEYLLAAIGSCTAMTVRMYADRKGWPLREVVVRLWQSRSYAEDCARCATERVGMRRVQRQIRLAGDLDDAQRERLLAIADRCPVKQTLGECIEIQRVD